MVQITNKPTQSTFTFGLQYQDNYPNRVHLKIFIFLASSAPLPADYQHWVTMMTMTMMMAKIAVGQVELTELYDKQPRAPIIFAVDFLEWRTCWVVLRIRSLELLLLEEEERV